MEKNIASAGTERIKGQNSKIKGINNFQAGITEINPILEKLARGKYRIFPDYLEWLGLADDHNIIVLSPTHHYYYDDDDLKEVTTVLNLRHLNQIKQVKEFLRTINQMLPSRSFFVGSFIDRKHQYGFLPSDANGQHQGSVDPIENGISSRIPILNMIYDFMDSRTNNRNLTMKSVSLLLEETGFNVLDMTEINGIACFCSQKIISPGHE
jgi:hypothetical protein